MTAPILVVVSGLPGTGKTAVADVLAPMLDAVRLSVDVLEEALLGAGLAPDWSTGVAAYEATAAAAAQNLDAGWSVVVDAVNDSAPARDTWTRAAGATGARLLPVLLRIDDPAVHRARLEGRSRPFVHVREPGWRAVQERAFAPWPDVLVLDAAAPVAALAARIAELAGQPASEYFAAGRPTEP